MSSRTIRSAPPMTGSATPPLSKPAARGPGDFGFSGGFADIFDEMFGEFMGGGRRGQAGPSRGSDLRYNLEISLEESFRGKQTTIRVPNLVACDQCNGSGAEAGSKPVTCPTCHGRGRVRTPAGFLLRSSAPAPACQGAGRVIEKPCKGLRRPGPSAARENFVGQHPARGRGRHAHPPRRRRRGRGARVPRPATSTFSSAVTPHPFFQRDGANIHCRVPISMTTAALGGASRCRPSTAAGRASRCRPGPNRDINSGSRQRA